ncbi:peptidoglycan DD-metalloendopeptidase family protein [Thalassotalea ganghwensis]
MKNLYIQLPKQHRIFISVISIILLLLILFPSEKATASRQTTDEALKVGQRYQLPVPQESDHITQTNSHIEPVEDLQTDAQDKLNWQTAKVRNGDSLAKIFKRLGYSAQTTYKVSQAKGEGSKQLVKLQVGDTLNIGANDDNEIVTLEYPLSKTKTLFIDKTDQGYQSRFEEKPVEIRESIAHGVVKNNFWNAGIEAGLNDNQIINLANVFGWDIDFAIDLRKGDSFHVVYENKYVDGEFIGTGNILAAEFVNQDEVFQAIRFSDGEYYTPDGNSMRKAFLRAPVNFKYISSNFKPKRFHPIQKRWKAHRGTDYRAATGTPVVASGDGKVTHSTYNKYNGHYVFIQHGNGIVTKYLHFSKRAVKKGQRVKQGQVIGYVGSTGMSQAPHLHYEFLLNGVHRNPRTVKLPDAEPIAKKYKAEFTTIAAQRLKELSGSRKALIAATGDTSVKATM